MKSKRFFSSVIFWKDLVRFWPLWVLELVGLLLVYILPLFSRINDLTRSEHLGKYDYSTGMSYSQVVVGEIEDVLAHLPVSYVLAGLSVVVAALVFSYLTIEREAYMMHSFPLKRETLFVSHYLAGMVMLAAPFAIVYLLLLFIALGNGAGVLALPMLKCFLEDMIAFFFFYNLACFVVMLTGNGIMMAVIYFVLNFLYGLVTTIYYELGEMFIYGWSYRSSDHVIFECRPLIPTVFLAECMGYDYDVRWDWHSFGIVACYLLPSVIFLVLALLLYRKRPIESAGDMVAFSWGRPIFRIVFSFCGGTLFALTFYTICLAEKFSMYAIRQSFHTVLVLVAVGVALCYLIGNMILYKTFRIWKRTAWLRMAILVSIVVGSLFYTKQRAEKYIPKVDDVVCLSVELPSSEYDEEHTFFYYDKKELEKFQELEREILKKGPYMVGYEDYEEHVISIEVTYYLKNGKKMAKSYPMLSASYPEADGHQLSDKVKDFVVSTPDMCRSLFGRDYEKLKLDYAGWETYSADEDDDGVTYKQIKSDLEEKERLYHAILQDMKAGRYELVEEQPLNLGILRLYFDSQVVPETDVQEETRGFCVDIVVTEQCTETVKALGEIKHMTEIELQK